MKKFEELLKVSKNGSQIKIFEDLLPITGDGEEWLVDVNGNVRAIFIDGDLKCDDYVVASESGLTNPSVNDETQVTKVDALSMLLDVSPEHFEQVAYDNHTYSVGDRTYLVLTEVEADDRAKDDIVDSVWAFDSNFIAKHSHLDEEDIKLIQENGNPEDNNKLLLKLIDNVDRFVDDAINEGGRGQFLAPYDLNERQVGKFFIYRTA